jgi:hypothetical protein
MHLIRYQMAWPRIADPRRRAHPGHPAWAGRPFGWARPGPRCSASRGLAVTSACCRYATSPALASGRGPTC